MQRVSRYYHNMSDVATIPSGSAPCWASVP